MRRAFGLESPILTRWPPHLPRLTPRTTPLSIQSPRETSWAGSLILHELLKSSRPVTKKVSRCVKLTQVHQSVLKCAQVCPSAVKYRQDVTCFTDEEA